MLDTLPTVAAEWVRMIHTDLRVGIGIHTGTVQVGNAGSTQRVKYGARGPNVHIASRVEAATKELAIAAHRYAGDDRATSADRWNHIECAGLACPD